MEYLLYELVFVMKKLIGYSVLLVYLCVRCLCTPYLLGRLTCAGVWFPYSPSPPYLLFL